VRGVLLLGRALRAGVTDRVQHVPQLCDCIFGGDASRGMPPCDLESSLAGMRVGAVLHPAMLLALVDGLRLLQHVDRPAAQRPDVVRSALLSQPRDSKSRGLGFSTCSARCGSGTRGL
jgi:hypothetical protein